MQTLPAAINDNVVPSANDGVPFRSGETNTQPNQKERELAISFVPDEYKDKPWVQEWLKAENPQKEFFKQYENAQTLVGKKSEGIVMPTETAPAEDWQKFFKTLVPETTEYKLSPTQWAPEDKELGEAMDKNMPPAVMDAMIKTAKENGVLPRQIQALKSALDKVTLAQYKEQQSGSQKLLAEYDKDFEQRTAKHFGDKKDVVLANGKRLLSELPGDLKEDVKLLDNRALTIMASALGFLSSRYIKEDSVSTSYSTASSAMTPERISEEGRIMMAHPAYSDPTHKDHDKQVRLVKEHYAQLKNLQR